MTLASSLLCMLKEHVASNNNNSSNKSNKFVFVLLLAAPPFISVSDMAVVTSEVDSEVILNFHVVSFTADVILSYEHNGSPLDTSSSHYRLLEHGALLIKHPRGRDAGNYMLHATNSLGTTSALILLTVQCKARSLTKTQQLTESEHNRANVMNYN